MKKIEFARKDGSPGLKYVLEPGDIVTAKFDVPAKTKLGKYDNYSLGVHDDCGYVQLTKGQYEKLVKSGDLAHKKIEAYEYENDFGKQVGVKVI